MLSCKQKIKIDRIISNKLRSKTPYDWQLDAVSYLGCESVLIYIAEIWSCYIMQQRECIFVVDFLNSGVAKVTANCFDKPAFIEISKKFLPANISIQFVEVDLINNSFLRLNNK